MYCLGRRSRPSALLIASCLMLAVALPACGGAGNDSTTGPEPPPAEKASLEVGVVTEGSDRDPDGYTLTLDGADRLTIDVNGSVTMTGLDAGSHQIELSGTADNCHVEGENPRTTNLTGGETASLTFTVSCSRIAAMAYVGFSPQGGTDIWTLEADGTNASKLTESPDTDELPRWSPDGSRIAFRSYRSGQFDIWVMRADGSAPKNLTVSPAQTGPPTWSPDGAKIAFSSNRSGDREIWIMDEDGSDPRNLTSTPGRDGMGSWSPDGARIAFTSDRTGRTEIWVMDANGSNQTQLTDSPLFEGSVSWSPDGARIAFVTTPYSELDPMRSMEYEIWSIDADGTNRQNLSNDPADDYAFRWSPDGARLAFTSSRTGNLEIWVINRDGTDLTRLTSDARYPSKFPSWSRDGTRIGYWRNRGGDHEIWVMDTGGSNPTLLTQVGRPVPGHPEWRP